MSIRTYVLLIWTILLLVFLAVMVFGCRQQQNPVELPGNALDGFKLVPIVLERKILNYVPPVPPIPPVIPPVTPTGFDYKLAEQRRLNHLVKFQEQLRKQQEMMDNYRR